MRQLSSGDRLVVDVDSAGTVNVRAVPNLDNPSGWSIYCALGFYICPSCAALLPQFPFDMSLGDPRVAHANWHRRNGVR